jgi:hypothetical protein
VTDNEMIAIMRLYGRFSKESYGRGVYYWRLSNIRDVTIRGLRTRNAKDATAALYQSLYDWMWNTVNDNTAPPI